MIGTLLWGALAKEKRHCRTILFYGAVMQCQKMFNSSYSRAFATVNFTQHNWMRPWMWQLIVQLGYIHKETINEDMLHVGQMCWHLHRWPQVMTRRHGGVVTLATKRPAHLKQVLNATSKMVKFVKARRFNSRSFSALCNETRKKEKHVTQIRLTEIHKKPTEQKQISI